MAVQIVALVGSLRAGSHNRQLAEAAAKLVPEGAELYIHEDLENVPFYNEDIDLEGRVPQQAAALRASVESADAVLLLTPEYNGAMPAVLKNAIDWLSRPRGASALDGKPVAVIGASGGQYGGTRALQDARKTAAAARAAVVEDITLSIPFSRARFADTHPFDDIEVADQLKSAVARLAQAAVRATDVSVAA